MDPRTEPIHQDIEQIRNSMTDKMSQIENRVRDSVDGTLESVKSAFDLRQHVEERPWTSLGAAVLAGYALGTINEVPMPNVHMPHPSEARQSSPTSSYGSESRLYNEPAQPQVHVPPMITNALSGLADQFGDEIEMVKSAAISAAVAFLRDTLKQNMPELSREYERLRQERTQSGEPSGMRTTHDTPTDSAKASNYGAEPTRTPSESRSPAVAVS